MREKEPLWAQEKLEKVNKLLESLGVGEIKVVEKNGVLFGVAGTVSDLSLDSLSKLFPQKPDGVVNCYAVAEYLMDATGVFDTIYSSDEGHIVQGDHCINFGESLLIDMSAKYYFNGIFDVMVISLPEILPDKVDSYTALANKVYGGDWQYFGKEGHNRFREIVENATKRAKERRRSSVKKRNWHNWIERFFRNKQR